MLLTHLIKRSFIRSFSSSSPPSPGPPQSVSTLINLFKPLSTQKPDPVTEVHSILTKSDLFESQLDPMAHKLDPRIVADVVTNPPNFQKGIRFFIWALKFRCLRAWELTNDVIDMVFQEEGNNNIDVYWDVIDEVRKSRGVIPADAFIVLISGYWKAGNAEKAVEAFGRMKEFDCVGNVYVYNAILYVLVQKDVMLLALAVYAQMVKLNCDPNVATYSILIDGLCKCGKVQDAVDLFDEMEMRGVPPNEITYTIVVLGLCQALRAYDAQVLLHKMTSDGRKLDSITCNGLLAGFCKLGRVDDAFVLLKLFEKQGYVMGIHGYSSLIDGLFRVGKFEEANKWFRKLVEEKVTPDVVLYTIMIRGFCEAGRIKEAWDFVQDMAKKGVVPDTQCYNTLIKGFCDKGLLDEAKSLKLEISKNSCFPDTNTYTILICGMCQKGLIGEAKELFEEMEKVGCFPSVVTFNALIDGLCKARELEEARFMFYKMEIGRNPSLFLRLSQGADRVLDKASLKNLVTRLCESGLYLKAYRLLTKLADNGVLPDLVTYNILLNGMCRSKDINGALKLFRELQLKGQSPDPITYSTLINGLCRVDREEEAMGMLENMIKNGCLPSPSVFKSLMTWSCRKRKVSVSFSLWLDYLRRVKKRDEGAIALIEKHFEKGELEAAVREMLEMDFQLKDFDLGPYTIWLIGLCQARRGDDALMIFRVLQEHDVIVPPASCAKLIRAFCFQRKLDVAVDVFLYSLDKGYILMPRICNLLLCSLLRSTSELYVNNADSLLEKMDTIGYDLDVVLSQKTKLLWQSHLQRTNSQITLEDCTLHSLASSR